jgi:hypothetical protein
MGGSIMRYFIGLTTVALLGLSSSQAQETKPPPATPAPVAVIEQTDLAALNRLIEHDMRPPESHMIDQWLSPIIARTTERLQATEAAKLPPTK